MLSFLYKTLKCSTENIVQLLVQLPSVWCIKFSLKNFEELQLSTNINFIYLTYLISNKYFSTKLSAFSFFTETAISLPAFVLTLILKTNSLYTLFIATAQITSVAAEF